MKKIRIGERGPSYVLQDEKGNTFYQCSKCEEIKQLNSENFYKQNTKISGFRSICKTCCDSYQMNRYNNEEGFKEVIKQNVKKWTKENPEKAKEIRQRGYYKDHEKSKKRTKDNLKKWKKNKCTSGIYAIENLKEKKIYIGESYAIENRWISHKYCLKTGIKVNRKLKKDWDKLGEENFKFDILINLSGSSKIERLIQEEKTIMKYELEGYQIYNNPNCRNKLEEEK